MVISQQRHIPVVHEVGLLGTEAGRHDGTGWSWPGVPGGRTSGCAGA